MNAKVRLRLSMAVPEMGSPLTKIYGVFGIYRRSFIVVVSAVVGNYLAAAAVWLLWQKGLRLCIHCLNALGVH